MRMWNDIDLDLCEARTTVVEDNDVQRLTATEYYFSDGTYTGCRDAHLEIKQGLSTKSSIGD